MSRYPETIGMPFKELFNRQWAGPIRADTELHAPIVAATTEHRYTFVARQDGQDETYRLRLALGTGRWSTRTDGTYLLPCRSQVMGFLDRLFGKLTPDTFAQDVQNALR